jgi:hypothetical protein
MSQTNNDPQNVTVRCSPLDFEQARERLEQSGYVLTSSTTRKGYLELSGTRKHCSCDLCREAKGEAGE